MVLSENVGKFSFELALYGRKGCTLEKLWKIFDHYDAEYQEHLWKCIVEYHGNCCQLFEFDINVENRLSLMKKSRLVATEQMMQKCLGITSMMDKINDNYRDALELVGSYRSCGISIADMTQMLKHNLKQTHHIVQMLISFALVQKIMVKTALGIRNMVYLSVFANALPLPNVGDSTDKVQILNREFTNNSIKQKIVACLKRQRKFALADIGQMCGISKSDQEAFRNNYMSLQRKHVLEKKEHELPFKMSLDAPKGGRNLWCVERNDNGRDVQVEDGIVEDSSGNDELMTSGIIREISLLEQYYRLIEHSGDTGLTTAQLCDITSTPSTKIAYKLTKTLLSKYDVAAKQVKEGKNTVHRFVLDGTKRRTGTSSLVGFIKGTQFKNKIKKSHFQVIMEHLQEKKLLTVKDLRMYMDKTQNTASVMCHKTITKLLRELQADNKLKLIALVVNPKLSRKVLNCVVLPELIQDREALALAQDQYATPNAPASVKKKCKPQETYLSPTVVKAVENKSKGEVLNFVMQQSYELGKYKGAVLRLKKLHIKLWIYALTHGKITQDDATHESLEIDTHDFLNTLKLKTYIKMFGTTFPHSDEEMDMLKSRMSYTVKQLGTDTNTSFLILRISKKLVKRFAFMIRRLEKLQLLRRGDIIHGRGLMSRSELYRKSSRCIYLRRNVNIQCTPEITESQIRTMWNDTVVKAKYRFDSLSSVREFWKTIRYLSSEIPENDTSYTNASILGHKVREPDMYNLYTQMVFAYDISLTGFHCWQRADEPPPTPKSKRKSVSDNALNSNTHTDENITNNDLPILRRDLQFVDTIDEISQESTEELMQLYIKVLVANKLRYVPRSIVGMGVSRLRLFCPFSITSPKIMWTEIQKSMTSKMEVPQVQLECNRIGKHPLMEFRVYQAMADTLEAIREDYRDDYMLLHINSNAKLLAIQDKLLQVLFLSRDQYDGDVVQEQLKPFDLEDIQYVFRHLFAIGWIDEPRRSRKRNLLGQKLDSVSQVDDTNNENIADTSTIPAHRRFAYSWPYSYALCLQSPYIVFNNSFMKQVATSYSTMALSADFKNLDIDQDGDHFILLCLFSNSKFKLVYDGEFTFNQEPISTTHSAPPSASTEQSLLNGPSFAAHIKNCTGVHHNNLAEKYRVERKISSKEISFVQAFSTAPPCTLAPPLQDETVDSTTILSHIENSGTKGISLDEIHQLLHASKLAIQVQLCQFEESNQIYHISDRYILSKHATECPITIPWHHLDGSINHTVLHSAQLYVLESIINHPGILETTLFNDHASLLLSTHILSILEMLLEPCLYVRIQKRVKITLFSNTVPPIESISIAQWKLLKYQVRSEYNIFYFPTQQAVIKLGEHLLLKV